MKVVYNSSVGIYYLLGMRLLFGLLLLSTACKSQSQINKATPENLYFGNTPPSVQPKLFAPEFISQEDRYEFGSVYSNDGKAFYFGVEREGGACIFETRMVNGEWSKPIEVINIPSFGYNDPMLSPDDQRLYFISNYNGGKSGLSQDYDIWYVIRDGNAWSQTPINAGPNINTDKDEYYISFTNDGAMYFGSNKAAEEGKAYNQDIYKSSFVNGEFQPAQRLDDNVNTGRYEADVFVAPDESYIIFCGKRREGLGAGDLYISFKTEEGNWTRSKNMGPNINTESHELCPYVSPDGKYLFYTSNEDIYWISTEVFEGLK